jgi:polyisoprenoid-binding protein YceI
MKKVIYPCLVAAIVILSAFTFYSSVSWKIADSYAIKFTSADPSGVFTSLKGDVNFDENDLAASKFDVTVDVNSINTGNGMKNKKTLSAEYFDADKYPTIKFTSTQIIKAGGAYQAKGNLTMHGVTKPMVIPFTFTKSGNGGTFAGSFDVNRTDFGVGAPGGHAAEVLKIDLSVPVTK